MRRNATNVRKHGIGFAVASQIFKGFILTEPDDRFDYGEDRELTFGMIGPLIVLAVVHTDRMEWSGLHPHESPTAGKGDDMKPPYERELTIEELAARLDEDIDFSDIPPVGEEFFRNARWVGPSERKQQLTIRFDPDIVEWFKAQGKGYQTHMNAVLRAYVDSKRQ